MLWKENIKKYWKENIKKYWKRISLCYPRFFEVIQLYAKQVAPFELYAQMTQEN